MILLSSDIVGLVVIFNIVHFDHVGEFMSPWSIFLPGIVSLIVFGFYIVDGYRVQSPKIDLALAIRIFFTVAAIGGFIAAVAYLLPGQTHAESRATILWRGVLPVALSIFALWAAFTRILMSRLEKRFGKTLKWLVVGAGPKTSDLAKDFVALNLGQLNFLDGRDKKHIAQAVENEGFPDVGEGEVSGIVIADDSGLTEGEMRHLMDVRLNGVRIYDAAAFYERYMHKIPIAYLKDSWFALSQGFDLLHHRSQLRLKGLLDKVVAVVIFLLCMPLFALIPLIVKTDSRGPVIYSQTRTGKGGREFVLYKFRTMYANAEEHGPKWAEERDPRITRIGRILRKTRLDELPQLWNVLRGDMSFIGPRPERPSFVAEIEKTVPYYELRHLVSPGITGWAQVMYPYGASIDDAKEKLQYDLYYIKNYSLLLDVVILIKTIRIVFNVRGR